jgi:glycosyltransferase involved in cell wall biosynthesis
MRIGLVCYVYPPQAGAGGVGTYMFRLAGALGRAGHQVHVIAGPTDRPSIQQPNVTIHRVAARFDLRSSSRALRWLYWHSVAPLMAKLHPVIWHLIRWDVASEAAIVDVDRTYGLDVIEAPEFAGNGWMAGRMHRWPIVLRMHCPWEVFVRVNRMRANPMHRLLAFLERKTVAQYADCITVPSQAMRIEAERSWTLRRPIRVIPNFMDVPDEGAPLPAPDGPQRIVCTGRIERLKGQDTLASAFAMIAGRHPRAELWLIGPDSWGGRRPFARMLESIVPDPAIRSRIHLTGMLPLDQCEQHVRTAAVGVVASIGFESFSLSALEMMAAARPMIVTRAGALPELIEDGQSGLVVEPGSAIQTAEALDRLLSDREFARRCAWGAHACARERYETSRVLPAMMGAYEEAADFHYGARSAVRDGLLRSAA